MISSRHDPEIIFTASKLGADEYLPKPFEAPDLELRISKILDKHRAPSDGTPASRTGAAKSRFCRTVRHQPAYGGGEEDH